MKTISMLLLTLIAIYQPDSKNLSLKNKRIPAEKSWNAEELARANTARNAPYLTEEEKKIVFYMNLARIDGTRFFNSYFQEFINENNTEMQRYGNYDELKIDRNTRYYRSLERDLKNIKNLSLFFPDRSLSIASEQHGRDMNQHNRIGHNSSNGGSAKNRIAKVYPNKSMAENLAFGFSSGLANVCMLLLDRGVPDLGHRKNILNTTLGLNVVGVSIQPHPTYRFSAVIDFVALPNLKN